METKNYYQRFIEKNHDKINNRIICPICCGSYTYFNKYTHLKSKKHNDLLLKYNQLLNNTPG